jgi:sarcosine oxidase subunit alpha
VYTFKTTDTQKSYRGMIVACPMDRPRGHTFVDFQHDVTVKDLKLATQEGFRSIEPVKRYTTSGMATDQGKTSNVNALAIVANQLGKPVPQVGLTTFRQPYTPVTFGTLARYGRGDSFDPIRRTPIDSWAQENGAVFEDVGSWKRARYFSKAGEDMHTAVSRECHTTRASCGIFDALKGVFLANVVGSVTVSAAGLPGYGLRRPLSSLALSAARMLPSARLTASASR